MYETFYGLREKPFAIQPDPDFLYLSQRHALAFTMLQYGIQNRAGFSVICGEIGCGKTTLIRHLLNTLGKHLTVGLVHHTQAEAGDLLAWALLAFGQPYEGLSRIGQYDAIQRFLIAEYAAGRRVVLIVDEAQNLGAAALESLRMLSNINADKDQLLQIILVGQPQLRDLLQRPDLLQFSQRVGADFFIPPLNDAEVPLYVRHRLRVAGRDEEPLFTEQALARVAQASRGIPRSINLLCDTALVYGFASDARLISESLLEEVLSDRRTFGVFTPSGPAEPGR